MIFASNFHIHANFRPSAAKNFWEEIIGQEASPKNWSKKWGGLSTTENYQMPNHSNFPFPKDQFELLLGLVLCFIMKLTFTSSNPVCLCVCVCSTGFDYVFSMILIVCFSPLFAFGLLWGGEGGGTRQSWQKTAWFQQFLQLSSPSWCIGFTR